MTVRAVTAIAPPRALSPESRGVLWGLVAVAIWGLYLAVARANVTAGVAPRDVALVRYATAGLILLPWLLRHSPATMAGIGWSKALILALLAGPLFILIGASGFTLAPLSHAAVTQPAAVTIGGLLLGATLLGDRLTRPRVMGAGVILAGLVLVAGPSALSGGVRALAGDALFAAAGLMWAGYAVLSRRWIVAPLTATAVVAVLSAAIYVPAYLFGYGVAALTQLPTVVLLELITIHGVLSGVIAVFAFGRAGELLGAPRAAAFPALVPVVAILAGIPITGEVPAGTQIIGLLIVTCGLLVIQQSTNRPTTVS